MSPLNFGNSSFGSFILTWDVEGADEEESCETIDEFEVLSFSKHLSTFANSLWTLSSHVKFIFSSISRSSCFSKFKIPWSSSLIFSALSLCDFFKAISSIIVSHC